MWLDRNIQAPAIRSTPPGISRQLRTPCRYTLITTSRQAAKKAQTPITASAFPSSNSHSLTEVSPGWPVAVACSTIRPVAIPASTSSAP